MIQGVSSDTAAHDIGFDSRQSGSRRRRQRHHHHAGPRQPALRTLRAAAGPQGHRLRIHRPRRADRKILRDGAGSSGSRFRGGDDGLARTGRLRARPERSTQGLCAQLRRLRNRRRDVLSRSGAAGLSTALLRAGAFDGRGGDAADRPRRPTLVRPHRAVGADDRPAGPHHVMAGADAATRDAVRRHGRQLRAWRHRRAGWRSAVRRQSPDQRPGALRPQRRDPRGRPRRRHRRADGGVGRHRVSHHARLSRHALPIEDSAADPDDGGGRRHHRLNAGDRGIRLPPARQFASGDSGIAARDPAGAGPLPRAVLGRVRRVRAGLDGETKEHDTYHSVVPAKAGTYNPWP